MEIQRAYQSKTLSGQAVQCTACEHWCSLMPGEVGKCQVRQNRDGELVSLVYGRAAAAHLDPIEKKPLFHFLPDQPAFSIGTFGCNFRCQFCQNWTLSQPGQSAARIARMGQALAPAEIVRLCRERSIPIIAYTYNEPTVFFEYTLDTARLAAEHGIRNVYVSNGFQTLAAIDAIAPYLDAINVDLKAFSDSFYRETCDGRLEPVLRNIAHMVNETGIWVEVTTLIIPGMNDSDRELREMAHFLSAVSPDIPWHLSAFHPDYRELDRPATPRTTLERAYAIGVEAGLRYVYVGNVMDAERSSTCCPDCGEMVLSRIGYRVRPRWQAPGQCPACGASVAGIWS